MQQTHPLPRGGTDLMGPLVVLRDRKSTRLNSSHLVISYAVFCLKKKINSCKATEPGSHLADRLIKRWPGKTGQHGVAEHEAVERGEEVRCVGSRVGARRQHSVHG